MAGIRKQFRSFSNSRMSSPMSIGQKTGNHVIKRERAGVEYVKPSWNGTETIFRFLPIWDAESSSWGPCRVPEDQGRYGSWQVCFEAVRNFGEPGVTMLLCDGTDNSYDPYHQNPCWLLYRSIKDACDRKQAKSEWYPLFQKGQARSAPLARPSEILLCQALVFRHRSKNTFGAGRPPLGFDQGDPTIVVELAKSAAQAMFTELDRRSDQYEGVDPDDPKSFVHPDIVSLNSGAFVHFYQLGFDPREKTQEAQQGFDPYSAKSGHGLMQPRNKEDIGYGAYITTTLDGTEKGITAALKGHEKKIKQKAQPWEKLLHFPSDEEQAHIINKLFPATAVYYAFNDDHPDWVLPDTRDSALGRKRVNVPGGVPVKRAEEPEDDPYKNGKRFGAQDTEEDVDDSANMDMFGPAEEVDEAETLEDVFGAPADDEDTTAVPSQTLPSRTVTQTRNSTPAAESEDVLEDDGVDEAIAAMEKAKARSRMRRRAETESAQ